MAAAVERLPLTAFPVNPQAGGKPQYPPRLMLALLVYCDANGVFSARRIERATHRDLGVRFVAAEDVDPQARPAEIARREALKAKLDGACARLEAKAREQAAAARPAHEAKKAAHKAKTGRRARPPKPPEDAPPTERQSTLTDPDSALMRRSDAQEYRQADNAQAVVRAEGSQRILATTLVA